MVLECGGDLAIMEEIFTYEGRPMTPSTKQEAERRDFESAASQSKYAYYSLALFGHGQFSNLPRTYLCIKTEAAWHVWQAARATRSEPPPASDTPSGAVAWASEDNIGNGVRAFTKFSTEEAVIDRFVKSEQASYAGVGRVKVALGRIDTAAPPAADHAKPQSAQQADDAPKPWQDRMTEHYEQSGKAQCHPSSHFMREEIADWRARGGQAGDALDAECIEAVATNYHHYDKMGAQVCTACYSDIGREAHAKDCIVLRAISFRAAKGIA